MILKKTGTKDGYTVLSDENGDSGLFDFIEMTVLDSTEYDAFYDVDTGDLLILELNEENIADEWYNTIDDDDIFEKACEKFAEEFPEEFDF
jgi:hypothetical protein